MNNEKFVSNVTPGAPAASKECCAKIPIYSEKELRALVDAAQKFSDSVFGDYNYTEESKRLKRLLDLKNGFEGPDRDLLMGSGPLVERVHDLSLAAPSFSTVVDLFRREAMSSRQTEAPMRMPPLILLGPPGIGKTYLVNALALALRMPYAQISMSSCDDTADIVGHSLSWKSARPGIVATTLLDSGYASPVILVDEIEKAQSHGHDQKPSDIWHALFEPENSRHFRDLFLGLPLRADYVIWVATANSLDGLPESVIDRAVVLSVEPPNAAERRVIADRIFAAFREEKRLAQKRLPNEASELLANHNPRAMKKILQLASGFAAESGTLIDVAEIQKARAIVDGGRHRQPTKIGFT